jgi:nitrite reductase/ring-hydroxylating ferredoxin subunit
VKLRAKFLKKTYPLANRANASHRGNVIIEEKPIASIPESDLVEATPIRVAYPPFDIVVVRLGTEVFAIEDACNHAGASLAEGDVREGCIECPLHRYAFSLRTGALIRPRNLCGPQRTFRVEHDVVERAFRVFETPRPSAL